MTTLRKTYEPEYLRTDGRGTVSALVSVFSNVDLQGDRVMPGAFELSLLKWRASGDPIPIIWSHDWQDPFAHIGRVTQAGETDRGLEVEFDLDVDDNPVAAQVYKLLAARRVKEFSFGYDVIREGLGNDGANELRELDLIEVGPTLKGANTETELLGVKSALKDMVSASDPRLFPPGTHPYPLVAAKSRTRDAAADLKARGYDPALVDSIFVRGASPARKKASEQVARATRIVERSKHQDSTLGYEVNRADRWDRERAEDSALRRRLDALDR